MSKSFQLIYDGKVLCSTVNLSHPLASLVPRYGKRMCVEQEVVLTDRNRDERICMAESFNTTHQTLVLLRDMGRRTRTGIVVPAQRF
jgi:hypothetical protein